MPTHSSVFCGAFGYTATVAHRSCGQKKLPLCGSPELSVSSLRTPNSRADRPSLESLHV